jgi:hypothetical protein
MAWASPRSPAEMILKNRLREFLSGMKRMNHVGFIDTARSFEARLPKGILATA